MIKLYYSAFRQAVRAAAVSRGERDAARAEAKEWREKYEALQLKLDERSDLFIEREFRLIDRFLTTQAKTYAITDEINAKKKITDADVSEAEWEAFRLDKIDFLEQCARDAGEDDPRGRAIRDFDRNTAIFRDEFEAERI